MPQGTVKAVYPIEGRRKPGAVLFQDGQKFTTFDAAVMRAAEGTEGQLVEYTTKSDGKYTNLASIRVLGAATSAQQAPRAAAPVTDEKLTLAILALGGEIRSLREAFERASKIVGGTAASVAPPPTDYVVIEDPIAVRQNLLAGKVGAAQAEASINALKKKYAKNAEKLLEAVNTLLVVNDIEAPA